MSEEIITHNKIIPTEQLTINNKIANNAEYSAKLNRSFAEYERGLGEQHTLLEVPN